MYARIRCFAWIGVVILATHWSPKRGLGQCVLGGPLRDNFWLGEGLQPNWASPANWSDDTPDWCHDVFIDLPVTTVMDLPGNYIHGRRIRSLTTSAAGAVSFGAGAGLPFNTRLYVIGDLIHHPAGGEHVLYLASNDAVFAGDPAPAEVGGVPGHGQISGFDVNIDGRTAPNSTTIAVAAVTDAIGCGAWAARDAEIAVGYQHPSIDGGVTVWPVIPEALGIIDPAICPGGPAPGSAWTLDGVTLQAKRARNLDLWVIRETGARPNRLRFADFFASGDVEFHATQESILTVEMGDDPAGGLQILGRMELGGPTTDPTMKGPTLQAERLVVLPSGTLEISDGADVRVERIEFDAGSDDLPAEATFQGGSSLRYGDDREDASQQPPTLFRVADRVTATRQPPLWFRGNSWIAPIVAPDPLNPYPDRDLLLELSVHLDIESVVSKPPAIAWHTGEVDLAMQSPSYSFGPLCEDLGLSDRCEAEVELIAADACNLFFLDAPEPRCLKHWRSLGARSPIGAPSNIKLVDRHDNHRPNAVPCEDAPPKEALYVKGDLVLDYGDTSALDLNDFRLYYGGEILDQFGTLLPNEGFLNGQPIPLLKTYWGDFNGDCAIDEEDKELFPLGDAVPPIDFHLLATNPVFDHDGDCHVGAHEYELFFCRLDHPESCPVDWTGCNGGTVALDCPQTARAPEFGQGFFVPPAAFGQSQAIAICIPAGIGPGSIAVRVKGSGLDPAVACVEHYVQVDGSLAPEVYWQPADSWGAFDVADPAIIPNALYEVQIEYAPGLLSLPSILTTPIWGDADESGDIDVADILCELDLFAGVPNASCDTNNGDFAPCVPDDVIDVADILAVLAAFAGGSFSDVCPVPCG